MILYKPYPANATIIDLNMKGIGWKLYIYCSASLRNRSLVDGLLSVLISGLCLSCSRSVGILVYMNDARKGEYKGGAF